MPYSLRGKCVVKSETGTVVKCHPTVEAAQRHLSALRINVQATEKAMSDLVNDDDFWLAQRAIVTKTILPLFRGWYIEGAKAASYERPVRRKAEVQPVTIFNLEAINEAATTFIANYIDDWWLRLESRQREILRGAIATAEQNGLGPQAVAEMIAPEFGPVRAQIVAITEITNLIGAGAQEQYRQSGFTTWAWRTVKDSRVDPICEARGKQEFPMEVQFQAAHPRCRCWPVPVGEPRLLDFIAA